MLQAASADGKAADARRNRRSGSLSESVHMSPIGAPSNQAMLRLQRKCDCGGGADCDCDSKDDKKHKSALHRSAASPGGPDAPREAPPIVHDVLRSPGETLDPATRAFFESRFRHDFGSVRIHADERAGESARAVKAHAYTVGRDIAFAQGLYQPRSAWGGALLAHELTHVVQQGGAPVPSSLPIADPAAPSEVEAEAVSRNSAAAITTANPATLSRATVKIGTVSAQIDYGNIIRIPISDYAAAIQSRFQTYAGAILDPAKVALVAALTARQQEWVLFALDVLSENTSQAPGLDPAKAFQRLLDHAPSSTTRALGTAGFGFEREVLVTSGWAEQAISGGLSAPTPANLSVIDPLLNPPPDITAPPGGVFDSATFNAELPGLTRFQLTHASANTAIWPGTSPQPLPQVKALGDVIQDQARSFFSPFAETARDNKWLAGWQYSSNIVSTVTDPAGNPAPITKEHRLALLQNRANVAGQDDSNGASLFSRTNFDPDRDGAAFEAIITALEADPVVQALLNDVARHTGFHDRATHKVAISTEVSSAIPECTTRWRTIRTLCHELMHSLAHPDFIAAITSSPRFSHGVTFYQVLDEGFAEVLGVQLFNHLRGADAALLGQLTQGLTGACHAPADAVTPGYGPAGANADAIRSEVGDQRFRAAYFYGRASLVGL
jgi:hypothetical protein